MSADIFQVMPNLTVEEYDALRADITDRGVLVPIVRDEHGRIVDGHHRATIAAELGIDCQVEIVSGKTDDELRELAFILNLRRRHLTRTQRRELIETELTARPDDSDRAVGRRIGVDHKTVGVVRREMGGEFPHPEQASRAEAEELTGEIRRRLDEMLAMLMTLGLEALSNRVSPAELVTATTVGIRKMENLGNPVVSGTIVRAIFEPFIDFLILDGDKIAAEVGPPADDPTFLPYTPEEKTALLDSLANAMVVCDD